MKKHIFTFAIFVGVAFSTLAQVKVGNNPNTINPSAVLELESTNKGFLPPRVVLTGENDNTTIVSPAKGLMVYNTANTMNGEGIYINTGNASNPVWSLLTAQNETNGSTQGKLRYLGSIDEFRTIKVMDLEFRARATGSNDWNYEVRMVSAPQSSVTFYVNRIDFFGGSSYQQEVNLTFTPLNWNTWQAISNHFNYTGTHSNLIHINSSNRALFYRLSTQSRFGVFVSMAIDAY